MRVNVWIPDALHRRVEEELPHVNVSALLQEALRATLGCRHDELACRRCAAPIDRGALIDEVLSAFYGDVLWALDPLVRKGGTAEGAGRVIKDIAERHRVSAAAHTPLPRPTRANRAQRARIVQPYRSIGQEDSP